MSKIQTLGQRCPRSGKMLIRGTFSQKKKLWEALESLSTELARFNLLDDVLHKEYPSTYARLCDLLRVNGRASFQSDGVREFQVVEGEMNVVRDWDVGEDGPVRNPAGKDEEV